MPSVNASGTVTTDGTEQTLVDTGSVAGNFVGSFNAVNMVAGDKIEVRLYKKILTGSTYRVVFYEELKGAQHADNTLKQSIPVVCNFGCKFTIKRTAGTDRAYEWELAKL